VILAISAAIIIAALALAFVLLLIVAINTEQLGVAPRTRVQAVMRRVLGVSVRREKPNCHEHERSRG
jgi:hypothetical protein